MEEGRVVLEATPDLHLYNPITKDTGPIRAEGTIVTMGRWSAFTGARLVDVHGCLYASATSSLLVMHPT